MLTFDVEEFDLPLEYGIVLSNQQQMEIGRDGLNIIEDLVRQNNLECTFFTTANFALSFPEQIKRISDSHEIASHSFYHSSYKDEDLLASREVLEQITLKKVLGLRMPRMKKTDLALIKDAGYLYDASLNPTWIPGRYNNLRKPRTMYSENGIIELPASVSPNLRVPLFWMTFKNFPYPYFKRLALQCLKSDGYLSLYFHPWEFTSLDTYNLPRFIKRKSGIVLLKLLQKLIDDLKKEGEFVSVASFLKSNGKIKF